MATFSEQSNIIGVSRCRAAQAHNLHSGQDYFPMSIFPIEPQHPFLATYYAIRPCVLGSFARIHWTSVSVRRVGCDGDVGKNPVAILAVCRGDIPHLKEHADKAVQEIKTLLSYCGWRDVHVHVAHTCAITAAARSGPELTQPDFNNIRTTLDAPYPGSSIAVKGALGCGSLGPLVSIRATNGDSYIGAVASHHVPLATTHAFDMTTVLPLPVNCPAEVDIDTFVQWHQDIVDSYEPKIRTAEERGKDATQLKESVAASRREIGRAVEATKEILLGEVLASSGNVNQGAGTTLYNWALIRVRPERVEGDRSVLALPPQPSSSESDQLLNRLSSLRRMDVLRSWESSIEEGRPKGKQASLAEILQDEDDKRPCAILHGRSSGYAVGYINGARDDVRLKFFGEEVRGRLYAIVNPRDRSSFSRSGNSGAAVYDRYARLLGTLVRGNDRGEQIGVSYVVPIQETLDHMKSTLDNTSLKIVSLEII